MDRMPIDQLPKKKKRVAPEGSRRMHPMTMELIDLGDDEGCVITLEEVKSRGTLGARLKVANQERGKLGKSFLRSHVVDGGGGYDDGPWIVVPDPDYVKRKDNRKKEPRKPVRRISRAKKKAQLMEKMLSPEDRGTIEKLSIEGGKAPSRPQGF